MKVKLTDSEKLERKLMRMFEKHFRNYKLNFERGDSFPYVEQRTYYMFIAYVAGYNKGKAKRS